MAARYDLTFTNAAAEVFDYADVDVLGRGGDWAMSPFSWEVDGRADGAEAVAQGAKFGGGNLVIPIGIKAGPGDYMFDLVAAIRRVHRPLLDENWPNSGWLYYKPIAISNPGTVFGMRRAAVPLPFAIEVRGAGKEHAYQTTMKYQCLTPFWEDEPATLSRSTISPGGSWTTFDWSITPGGEYGTPPTYEIDGPSSGSTTSITITNNSNGRSIALSGLTLSNNQRLIITTGYKEKGAKVYSVSGGVTGSLLGDVYYKRSQTTEFFPLITGAQTVTITKNNNAAQTVRATYRRRWTGV